jgi:hypothetical protein
MFFRIDYLKRTPRPKRICQHFRSADCQTDIEKAAWRECDEHRADGFRLLDLHTGETKVIWS